MEQTAIERWINIKTSVNGTITFESAVRMTGGSLEAITSESDKLVAECFARYPLPEPPKHRK